MDTPYSQLDKEGKKAYKRAADKRCKARKALIQAGKPIPPELQKQTPEKQKRHTDAATAEWARDDGELIINRYKKDGCRIGFNPDVDGGLLSFSVPGLNVWFDVTAVLVHDKGKDGKTRIEMNVRSMNLSNRNQFVKSPRIWVKDLSDQAEQLRVRNFVSTVQPFTAKVCKEITDGKLEDFLKTLLAKADDKHKMTRMLKSCASDGAKEAVAKALAD